MQQTRLLCIVNNEETYTGNRYFFFCFKRNLFRDKYIIEQYIAFAIHLARWMAPGTLKEIPRGGIPPRKITVNSNNTQ